ncbi:protein king tubby 1 [Cladochytrium replicatum]|nr:protein king tubby 1 [Cladochytrium replicatum]
MASSSSGPRGPMSVREPLPTAPSVSAGEPRGSPPRTLLINPYSLSRASTGSQLDLARPVSPVQANMPTLIVVPELRSPSTINSPESSTSDAERASWAAKPIAQGPKVLCEIIRRKEGVDKLHPQYELFTEEPDGSRNFVLAARKRKKSKSSLYDISTASINDEARFLENVVGKVKSNFLGTAFVIYDTGHPHSKGSEGSLPPRTEYGAVLYVGIEPNILGFKGPRKMTVLLPGMTKQGERIDIKPDSDHDTMLERYKTGRGQEIFALQNKQPQWNVETDSFVLNFNGRVTQPSVKNFQIVHDEDLEYIIMQFGRVGDERFKLDFQYPLSPLQAFAIALTSFDAKLACVLNTRDSTKLSMLQKTRDCLSPIEQRSNHFCSTIDNFTS